MFRGKNNSGGAAGLAFTPEHRIISMVAAFGKRKCQKKHTKVSMRILAREPVDGDEVKYRSDFGDGHKSYIRENETKYEKEGSMS